MDGLHEVIPVSQYLVEVTSVVNKGTAPLEGLISSAIYRPLPLNVPLGNPAAPQGAVHPTWGITGLEYVSTIILYIVNP
jgi:hypothetical protein